VVLGPVHFERRLREAARDPEKLDALRAWLAAKVSAAGRFTPVWSAFLRAVSAVGAGDGAAAALALREAARCRLSEPFFSWR
jgi:hypothetical protein